MKTEFAKRLTAVTEEEVNKRLADERQRIGDTKSAIFKSLGIPAHGGKFSVGGVELTAKGGDTAFEIRGVSKDTFKPAYDAILKTIKKEGQVGRNKFAMAVSKSGRAPSSLIGKPLVLVIPYEVWCLVSLK